MSDLNISKDATDLFSLGGSFRVQSSTTTTRNNYATVEDASGDNSCESDALDVTFEYSATYKYCGSTLGSDLDTALLDSFGQVKNSKLVDSVGIRFSSGEAVEITVNGHNHSSNAHDAATNAPATFDGGSIITTTDGTYGVEDFLAIGSGDSCVISADVTFELDHVDRLDSSGDHAAGENMNGRVTCTLEYLGGVTGSPTGWVVDDTTLSDENADFDTASVTAHKFLSRNP